MASRAGGYAGYLGVLAEEEAALRQTRYGRLSRGWVIGSAEFRTELKKELIAASEGERFRLLGADREAHRELSAEIGEEKLVQAAKAQRISLAHLPDRQSAGEKVTLAATLKTTTSVSNGWLAERLGMGSAANVSQSVRRLRLRDGKKSRCVLQPLS